MLAFLGLSWGELIVLGALFLPGAVSAIPAYAVLNRTPQEFRRLRPKQALLLLIPVLWLITNFLVHPKVARSVGDYARERGIANFGDGGASLARMFSICVLAWVLFGPLRYVGLLFLVVALVLLAVLYARLFSISKQLSLLAQPGASPNGGPTQPLGNSGVSGGPPSVS